MNPYIILGVGAVWLGSLVGVGYWQNKAGHTDERTTWLSRENKELTEANQKIADLNTAIRETERQHTVRLSDISTAYQKELKNAKAQRDRDVATARAGTLRLQFTPDSQGAGGSETGSTAATASGCNGAERTELPRETVADLLELVNDADDVVRQLTACQAVILSDRQ